MLGDMSTTKWYWYRLFRPMDCVGDRIVELNQPDLFLFGFIGAVEDRNAYLVGLSKGVRSLLPIRTARPAVFETSKCPIKPGVRPSDIRYLAARDKLINAR